MSVDTGTIKRVARQIIADAESGAYLCDEGTDTLEYFWQIIRIAGDIIEDVEVGEGGS